MGYLYFEIDMEPHPKQRPRFDMNTGRIYNPVSNREAEEKIKRAFIEKYPDHNISEWSKKPLHMRICFLFECTQKHEILDPHTSKPDIDNLAKTVLDALNGVAYADDSCVFELRVLKRYDDRNEISVSIEFEDGDCE